MSRLDPRGGVEECRVFIPAEARVLSAAWSFIAAGLLCFDLVYDPTGTVEHPLEPRGEAIRVWPLKVGATIDVSSLPYASLDVRWTSVAAGGLSRV